VDDRHVSSLAAKVGLGGVFAAVRWLALAVLVDAGSPFTATKLDVHQFVIFERDSGPVNYYRIVYQPEGPAIHAHYRPPLETVTLASKIPEVLRTKAKRLRWRWRVLQFPTHGNDCVPGRADSAASVFLTFKRGLKYYTLKYVWSTEGVKGTVCDPRRNPFYNRDTIVLESGGPKETWLEEEIDLRTEFLKHFEPGGTDSDVPDFVGIGVFTDGDQTKSEAEADYAQFFVLS